MLRIFPRNRSKSSDTVHSKSSGTIHSKTNDSRHSKSNQRSKQRTLSLALVFMAVFSAAMTQAGPFSGPGERGSEGVGRFYERFADAASLNDEQRAQVADILEKYHPNKTKSERSEAKQRMMSLSPGDANYLTESAAIAQEVASKLEQRMLNMAKARQEIYAILDPEQQEMIEAMFAKKQERMRKHMNKKSKCDK